jgi:methionyl aminopeptidase
MSIIKNQIDLDNLRHSARILASCLHHVQQRAKAGTVTSELNDFAIDFIRSYDSEPAFLGLYGFPTALIVEINDTVVHGIPSPELILPDNCVVSFDCGVKYKGMFSDACVLGTIGTVDERIQNLVAKTRESLMAGIKSVKAGNRVGDIGNAVDSVLSKAGLGNVLELGGHGLGYKPHDDPFISHAGRQGKGAKLFENMVIAIEPMVTLGDGSVVHTDIPGSSVTHVRTPNGEWSAHIEHTILVTKTGYEILTELKEGELLPVVHEK